MKLTTSFSLLFFYILPVSFAASTPCKKDSCYNAIASNAAGAPNLNSRRNDCSRVLRTVEADELKTMFTTTITSTTVVGTSTVTYTTFSTRPSGEFKRRQDAGVDGELTYAVLDARDKIVVDGTVPKYAKACKNIQAYGVGCLCAGVRPAVFKQVTTTVVVTSVTKTTSTPTATTVLPGCKTPYICGGIVDRCGTSRCVCARTDQGNVCVDDFGGNEGPCTSTSNCPTGYYCARDFCVQDPGICLPVGTCQNPLLTRFLFANRSDGRITPSTQMRKPLKASEQEVSL